MQDVECPYCHKQAEFVDSKVVYGKSHGMIYLCRCKPDFAYVGVHKGTDKPLGSPADRMLRYWRGRAHAAFDPIWKKKAVTRSEAYQWLAQKLGIHKDDCHIGMFDTETCKKVVDVMQARRMQMAKQVAVLAARNTCRCFDDDAPLNRCDECPR